ncbi:hypothetical protein IAR55_000169 [Kwoniella newhampshirensis]|uniref:NmrA-like domain-containing protein n=1 Tax=Kwoniella newhampshirensis TaxID=1651941 RepID=A0AAW0Z5Z1_9TREE
MSGITQKRKIVVFTATGDQGRSVCRYLIEDGGWDVVGISRNSSSVSSKELEKIGVRVVEGDLDDSSSYTRALQGAYGAFINADFMAPYIASGLNASVAAATEKRHALGAVEACAKTGVEHAIYTALEGMGDQSVPHYVSKREVIEHIKSIGLPTTYIHTSRYFSNMIRYGELVKSDAQDASFVFGMRVPDDTLLPCFAVEQIGAFVLASLKKPEKYIGKDIQACGQILTASQIAQTVSQLSGKKIDTLRMSKEEYYSDKNKQDCMEELWLQYRIFVERTYDRDPEWSKQVVPDVWDCRTWALNNQDLRKMLDF